MIWTLNESMDANIETPMCAYIPILKSQKTWSKSKKIILKYHKSWVFSMVTFTVVVSTQIQSVKMMFSKKVH